MVLHTYIVQYVHSSGNGWAIMCCTSPSHIEGALRSQSRFPDARVTSFKEVEYFGNETSLICEGNVTTYAKTPYDLAVLNGFEGTEQEWLESLKGESGNDATINGVSTLLIEAGDNINIRQEGNTIIISAINAVTSVNGQTGDVVLPSHYPPVLSVNGQIGHVNINIPTISTDILEDKKNNNKVGSAKVIYDFIEMFANANNLVMPQ